MSKKPLLGIGKRPFPTKRAALQPLDGRVKSPSKNKLSVILMSLEGASSLVNGFFMFFLGAVAYGIEKTGLDSFISDFELEELLDKKCLRASFDKGEIHCATCGETITRNNLGLIAEKKELDFICRNPACSIEYERRINNYYN